MTKPHRAKKEVPLKISDRDTNYRRTFLSTEGEQVLNDLKTLLRHGENIYNEGDSNSDLHYKLGRQSVINDILFILNKSN